jgi:NADPH:quinone reductase-like Zn-dependent oxidoreductase
VQRRYGADPSDVLRCEEIPVPEVGPHDVLIRVAAAGVDRGTLHLMTGTPLLARAIGFGLRRPRTPVPGRTVAGVVAADAGELRRGEPVFGTATATFAEYAVARRDAVTRTPVALSPCAATTLPDSGLTALQAVRDMADVGPGDRVAVLGASGGVGSFAVQLAKTRGAHVTGVAGPAKQEFVAGLGADRVLDYTRSELAEARYDVVIDIAGNRPLRRLRAALTDRGRLVIVGGEGGSRLLGGITRNAAATVLSPFVRHTLRAFVTRSRVADMDTLAGLAVAGAVRPMVHATYPLEDAATALGDLAFGRICGKAVVVP